MSNSVFALRSFSGKPHSFFRVERDDLKSQAKTSQKNPSHHILVVDRSGSMYGDMDPLKVMIEKLLTLGEFNDPSLRVSLVSYSSQGDVTLHFKKATVSEVMAASSPHLKAIRALRATALTCISQGLKMAETLIDDSEVTCVTLHTDGFANDSSPSAESRAISAVVESFKKHPSVFVNTIAYRGYCDFTLLSGISNALSGVCIQAKDIRQVHDAIHGAMSLLVGSMSPAIEVPRGNAQYLTFVSKSSGKILGATDNLLVRGLAEKDDRVAYRYFEISEEQYLKSSEDPIPTEAVLAFARAQISEGRLNAAKYALVATKNEALLKAHAKALVSSDVAAFAAGVESEIFKPTSYTPSKDYGLSTKGPSVLSVLSILDKSAKSLSVNLPVLLAGYQRRGVKRIPGSREEGKTEVIQPLYESRRRSEGDGWVEVNGFELNRNTATVNMLLSQEIDIFPTGGKEKVASVAGISLDKLRSYNNYTIVSDGSLNVSQVLFRTSDKRCFRELKEAGAVTGEYKPNEPFAIDFSEMPLVAYDAAFDAISPAEIRKVAQLTVLSKILSGMTKGESASLTGDQVTELKKFYLTPALNFSPPTTTVYADLAEAIASGQVDSRLSYKIDLGYSALSSVSKLDSGNAYLQRRFTLSKAGKEIDKPTLLDLQGSKIGLKTLSSRTKLDEVDTLSMPVYESLFNMSAVEVLNDLASEAGFEADRLRAAVSGSDKEELVSIASEASKKVDQTIESFFDRVRPLSFYIGATGLVPDNLGATALTADQFSTRFPDTKLSKKEKEEGTFFLLPNGLVITVYVENVHFSVSTS